MSTADPAAEDIEAERPEVRPVECVAESLSATASAPGGMDDEPAPARALHVLVVDDVLMNRDVASSFLRTGGHNVTCAQGGAEAVAAVGSTDFDVVLMDIRMPEMDGLEATRRIRALGTERGQVPVVALSAHASTDQVEACRRAGMDGHLPKPFNQEALLVAVVRAAGAGRVRREGLSSAADPCDPPHWLGISGSQRGSTRHDH